jgi:hypothetical protein
MTAPTFAELPAPVPHWQTDPNKLVLGLVPRDKLIDARVLPLTVNDP